MSNRKGTFDVYINNLPDDIDEDCLRKEFSMCGGVQSVTIKDGKNNSTKFGFVRYFKEEAQEAAMTQLNGKYIKGKVVLVRKADFKKKTNFEGNGDSKRLQRGDYQTNNAPHQSDSLETSTEYIEQVILITYVVDACTVFAQLAHRDQAEVSAKLMMDINQYCSTCQRQGPDQPDLNKVYGALFSEDGMWYRCKVSPSVEDSAQQNSQVRVHYLDYGNDEVVDSRSLVELPMSLASLAPQAHMLIFRGVKPTAQTVADNKKAIEFLQGITEDKSVMARLYCPLQTTSSSTPVEIYDGASSLSSILIERGFAVKDPPPPSPRASPIAKPPTAVGLFRSTPSPAKGSNNTYMYSPQPVKSGGRGLLETPDMQPINIRNQPSPMTPGLQQNDDHLQGEVAALTKEIGHLKTDKTELVKKCKEYLGEISTVSEERNQLQTQFYSLKEAATNTLDCLRRFEDKYKSSMQNKMSGLLKTLSTLKQIRKQNMSDPDAEDPVENAIALLTDSTGAFVSLRDGMNEMAVKSAQTELSQHQDQFYQPDAKDKLGELIWARDEVRQRTFNVMSAFLDVVNNLPVAEMKANIESCLHELEAAYLHILSSGVSQASQPMGDKHQMEACISYKEWKEKKSQQVKKLRETTDELAAQWRQMVQENLLDPFDLTSHLSNQSAPAFDDLVCRFIVAMETEIAMTGEEGVDLDVDPALLKKKEEERGQEMVILTSTVCMVVTRLQRELEEISYISKCQATYMATHADLQKWLTVKPDVSGLQAVQKVIKVLKSKLRHKLADKEDLEENPELNSGGELHQVEQELAGIRLELQKAFVEEDKLMEDVSDLSRRHFPELSHQYPSFDIEHYLDTLGLVKRGRDLHQFDLRPLPGCDKKTIHLGQYNGKPVIIKSYFMPDEVRRQEFLMQSVKALTYGVEGRLLPEAIYSLSNLGEIHVQLPYIEMGSLEAAIAKEGDFATNPLTDYELRSIFRNVLTGIGQLQEYEINNVHGAIHPRNVLLTSRSSAVLAEYDNTKTPTQRAQQVYNTKHGLCFSAPEVNSGHPAAPDWDMYSFGMILLWAHYPEVAFPILPSGIPNHTFVDMSPPLTEAVSALLSLAHTERPDAEAVSQMEYFTTSSMMALQGDEEEREQDKVTGCELDAADAAMESLEEEKNKHLRENGKGETLQDEQNGANEGCEQGRETGDEEGAEVLEDEKAWDVVKETNKTLGDKPDKTVGVAEDTQIGKTQGVVQETGPDDTVCVTKTTQPVKTHPDDVIMPAQTAKIEVSSPTSRSLLLRKMVAAMATSGESAKDAVLTKMQEGSAI